ncbi:hypothetical protein [Arthrobacter sp. ERGS1:01]|uniref:hypothetical protein n=1 Tax=Arthrobacter sp. ERGS1:01 TaxID=1704044 RepID=UPI0012379C92|nr:hypothetical protein [Arthrobacter sp. ERGS1:01]
MANAYADISSPNIRRYFVHELRRLCNDNPAMECWKEPRVAGILREPSEDLKAIAYVDTSTTGSPIENAIGNSVGYGVNADETTPGATTTPTTTTTTSNEVVKRETPQKRGIRIPVNFSITAEMAQWASVNAPNVDFNLETIKFKNHWESKPGRDATKLDWVKTWHNWILSSRPSGAAGARPTTSDKIRDTFTRGQALQAQITQTHQPELGA